MQALLHRLAIALAKVCWLEWLGIVQFASRVLTLTSIQAGNVGNQSFLHVSLGMEQSKRLGPLPQMLNSYVNVHQMYNEETAALT